MFPSVVKQSVLYIVALMADHTCHGVGVVGSDVSPEQVLVLHVLGLLELFLAQSRTFLEGQSEILSEIFRHRRVQAATEDELRYLGLSTQSLFHLHSRQRFTNTSLQLDHFHFERLVNTCLLNVDHEDCLFLVDSVDCVFDRIGIVGSGVVHQELEQLKLVD